MESIQPTERVKRLREHALTAQAHPEMYRDLVVRIGGYSDYADAIPQSRGLCDSVRFVGLSPEIIQRSEHAL